MCHKSLRFVHEAKQSTGGSVRQNRSSRFGPASHSLVIPGLGKKVEPVIESFTQNASWASYAIALLDAGYLNDDDKGSPQELVSVAMTRLVDRHAGELANLDFSISISHSIESIADSYFYDMDASEIEQFNLKMAIHAGEVKGFSLRDALQNIATRNQPLAETALYWLGHAGARTLNFVTPWVGRYHAEFIWWNGVDSDEDWREMVQEEYGYDEEEIAQMVCPSMWDKGFPEWVVKSSQKLSVEQLSELATSAENEFDREVAQVVADIASIGDAELPSMAGTDAMQVHFGAVLRWDAEDLLGRFIDDWYNQANQYGGEGYTEMHGLCGIPIDLPGFTEWRLGIEKGFAQIKNLERLINLVAVPII